MAYHAKIKKSFKYKDMSNSLFNSDFAKNSKFEESFVGNILSIDEWLQLVSQFKRYL